MGIRVSFDLGAEDGLESILLNGMRDYRDWLDNESRLYPMDHDPVVLATADSILDEGRTALEANTVEDALRIDNLVSSFVGVYCDYGPGASLLKDISSGIIYVRNYSECSEHFEPDSEPSKFWNFLLRGRPVVRDAKKLPFNSSDGIFRVSFASAAEVMSLRRAFETMNYYGDRSVSALQITKKALKDAELKGLGLIITIA